MDRGLRAPERIAVRSARPDDEAFVVSLASRFAETRPPWRSESEVTRGTEAELRRAFRAPDDGSTVFIAEGAAGERLGFAYLVLHEDFFTKERHGHVSEIATVRSGDGAGRRLMAASEEYFQEAGVRFITLNVNEANARGRRFYEALGFEPQVRQYVRVLRERTPDEVLT